MQMFEGIKDYEHGSTPRIGLLVVNLGTPDAPTPAALRRYLKQFLWDPRVIELSRPLWWLILHLSVLTRRPRRSAKLYRQIWTEEGSPLLLTTLRQSEKLERRLKAEFGSPLAVAVGMRYGNPSIDDALRELKAAGARRILVLPLYPQYSGTSSGSSFDAVADALKKWRWVPELRSVMHFHDHPGYIAALASSIKEVWAKEGRAKKLLMSFHGIPKRYVTSGDPYYCHCQKTGRLLAAALDLKPHEYLVSFQSLFGKEEWVRPYTDQTLIAWGKEGLESVDVVCPGFTADCLETLEEIEVENRRNFTEAGGKHFRYIPCLNDRDDFIAAIADICAANLSGWVVPRSQYDEQTLARECRQSEELYHEAKLRAGNAG